MATVAVIGGTGAALFPGLDGTERLAVETPCGPPSAPLRHWSEQGHRVVFLARHGDDGSIAPHRVNYRANMLAIAAQSPDWVVALNAVGAIAAHPPGSLVIPDQLVDYTWGREHTYVGDISGLKFTEITEPYDPNLRQNLVAAGTAAGLSVAAGGVYGVTQGPRLETAAEIDRLERDGCTLVGMTSMPEAGLAAELELRYACCAIVVNYAAGRSDEAIHAEMEASVSAGMNAAAGLLRRFLADL